ncbi:ASCH domain-containing protein [Acidovorax sp. sic0104]|uniref:ASCH domain-containing protein n=1 Tax=Acidovorax sp. sic0104 TaxID=2854784 RepID=UPI001C456B94|nr:ASCH domain-containing protein [Acidovorax sp. sic0104]MBV7543056.1 ASCH domain-containing protein [Acidovorax sp. sic0104]
MTDIEANRLIVEKLPGRTRDLFGRFAIGDETASRDAGVDAVLSGVKTATSSLPSDFCGVRLPFVGALSVLEDGCGRGRVIVETTEVALTAFGDVSASFVGAYGEGDGTHEWFREHIGDWYRKRDETFGDGTIIVCEHFKVAAVLNLPESSGD